MELLGRLTCVLQKDPNDKLKIANGSIISFIVDRVGVFWGYVFTIGTDADANYKIICYDQLRYLKNTDVRTFSNMTASNIFAKICEDYNLRYTIKAPTSYVPNAYQFNGQTLYTMIERGMHLANINDKKQYFIIDNNGTLEWSEFGIEGTNLSIALQDGAGITSYTYEKSIDNDTYNRIKLYRENQDAGKIDVWYVNDSNNEKRWGILQYAYEIDDNVNSSQEREYTENLLKAKNRETQTLKIQGNGILDCTAGKRLKFVLERESINQWMWIKSSTHTFNKYEHTMDLEVEV